MICNQTATVAQDLIMSKTQRNITKQKKTLMDLPKQIYEKKQFKKDKQKTKTHR